METEDPCPNLSLENIQARAEQLAHSVGLPSAQEAFRQLDSGELNGTILEVELKMLRFLKGE
jgi:hypothetical protein